MKRELRQETAHLPLPEMVEHVVEKSGLAQHYRTEKEGQERLENLDELINAAATFVDADGVMMAEPAEGGALVSFLTHASLEAGEHQAGEGDEAVQLMTVHAAKGLEFDVVFISGLEQGLFPHENSVLQGQEGIEEERRLMYVALTRARQRLYLTFAQTRMLHGQTRYCVSSSFLDEIPENLLKKMNQAAVKAVSAPNYGYASAEPVGNGLRVGQTVEHAKFGMGVIVSTEGRGADARVQVNFGGAGMKWLALEYAKLTPVS